MLLMFCCLFRTNDFNAPNDHADASASRLGSRTNTLAAAVQQHPHASLKSFEAGLRRVVSADDNAAYVTQCVMQLALPKWLTSSLSTRSFWAAGVPAEQQGGKCDTDDLVVCVCSLLRTFCKAALHIEAVDTSKSQLLESTQHAFDTNQAVHAACLQLTEQCMQGGGSSSSSGARTSSSSGISKSTSSSSSSSRNSSSHVGTSSSNSTIATSL
jgi:uncharacterized membrane protein YgcG